MQRETRLPDKRSTMHCINPKRSINKFLNLLLRPAVTQVQHLENLIPTTCIDGLSQARQVAFGTVYTAADGV